MFRRALWMISLMLITAVTLVTLGFGIVFLENEPRVPMMPPPSAEDVAATRTLVQDIRAATQADADADGRLTTQAATLNQAMRLGARFIPEFRGHIGIEQDTVMGSASVPVPWITGRKWLNVWGQVPEFEGQLVVSNMTIGNRSVPPGLVVYLARTGANLALGNQIGDTMLQAASRMDISGSALTFQLTLEDMGKNGLMRGTFGALRGSTLPQVDQIDLYDQRIRDEMLAGRLRPTSSFLPYLRFTLDMALQDDAPIPLRERYTAAILALAKICGAVDFSAVVGRLVFENQEARPSTTTSCAAVTFNGRIDSRRHFVTSAALQAISNTGFATSVGEFKELYDTISGSMGFDLTDMAANLSGVRISNVLMEIAPEEWPSYLGRLQRENDVIISFDGIPGLMAKEVFEQRYGDIEDARYQRELARIDARISQLRLYQGAR